MTFIKKGLSNNQLKILALIFMTVDHVAKVFFPNNLVLLIIGRLSFPIFVFMIAEGCRYTKNIKRYMLNMAVFTLVCQLAFTLFTGSFYMCILFTFLLSIIIIYFLGNYIKNRNMVDLIMLILMIAITVFLCYFLPNMLEGFVVDYGFAGVMIPVVLYVLPNNRWYKLLAITVLLVILSLTISSFQFYCLLSLPILLLYNGKRGKMNLKYLFYIYYPLHMLLIEVVSLLVNK